jgi:hypothetical protein
MELLWYFVRTSGSLKAYKNGIEGSLILKIFQKKTLELEVL